MRVLLCGESWVTHSVHIKGAVSRHAGRGCAPVLIDVVDDRVEAPQGIMPVTAAPGHPLLNGVAEPWPALLGYNRVTPRASAEVVVCCGDDPLVVCGQHHAGRSAAFTFDCAPHWAPPAFLAWPGYQALWPNL